MARWSLRFLNRLISLTVTVALVFTALYAGFALWDNHRIYEEADSVFDEMRAIKARFAAAGNNQAAPVAETAGSDTPGTPGNTEINTNPAATVIQNNPAVPSAANSEASMTADTESSSIVNPETAGRTETNAAGIAVQGNTAATQPANMEPAVQQSAGQTVIAQSASGTIAEALPVQEEPVTEAVPDPVYEAYGAPFDELIEINPDVNGWLTLPGTAIDYPLVQGENNFTYLNKDVYGDFSLAGSIYLDSRNDNTYADLYSLLYGHNMSKHRMFGDVNLYKDETFFEENREGQLFLRDREHSLTTLSCIVTASSDSTIFNPENWTKMTEEQLLAAVRRNALHVNEDGITALQTKMENGEQPRILAMSTCSDEFTDARTILLTLLDPDESVDDSI